MHHSVINVLCSSWVSRRVTRLPPSRSWPQISERQHIGIRPVSRLRLPCPLRDVGKLISQTLRIIYGAVPQIPDVVRDAPHLGIFAHLFDLLQGCRPRRQTERNRPAGFGEGCAQHSNFIGFVGTAADAIHLDQVHVPTGVQLRNRIVVGLRSRLRTVNAVVVEVPGTGIGSVCRVGRVERRSLDRQIFLHRLFRNAAQNMDAKFQAKRVDVIRQRLEASVIRRGRKPVYRRSVTAVLVQAVNGCLGISLGNRDW